MDPEPLNNLYALQLATAAQRLKDDSEQGTGEMQTPGNYEIFRCTRGLKWLQQNILKG